jgi:hypothetical protein
VSEPLADAVPTGENLGHQLFISTLGGRQVVEKLPGTLGVSRF